MKSINYPNLKITQVYLVKVCLFICFFMSFSVSEAMTENDIYHILEKYKISFDTNAVQKTIIDNMLKTIDPMSKILPLEDIVNIKKKYTNTIEKAEEWPEEIYYLKIYGFYNNTGSEIAGYFKKWFKKSPSGLILDMRGANGTSLTSVDEIAGLFTNTNTILYNIQNGRGQITETHYSANVSHFYYNTPLILLIDKKTNAASELFAAIMKNRRKIMLLGTKTKGYAGLREIIPLSDSESVYITTGWMTPAEQGEYNSVGIKPDITISDFYPTHSTISIKNKISNKPLSEKAKRDRKLMKRVEGDPVLERATDILLGLRALGFNKIKTNKNAISDSAK